MIDIKIQSEIMTAHRQFTNNRKAETFLRRIKRIHDLTIKRMRGAKPRRIKYPTKHRYDMAMQEWKCICLPVKVNIIDTNAAQLNLQPL